MVNINLHSEKEKEEFDVKESSSKASAILAVIFLILLLSYGGMFFYNKRLIKKSEVSAETYKAQSQDFMNSEKTKNVFNFQNRLDVSAKMLAEDGKTLEILAELERVIVPGTYLNSFDYDGEKKSLALELVSDQYNNVAKQVLKFKESDNFSEVILSTTAVDEKGKIRMPVELKLKSGPDKK